MNKVYVYEIDKITLNEYKSYVEKLSLWYQEQRKDLEALYEEMLVSNNNDLVFEITRKHETIIVKLLQKILDILDINADDMGVYLSNSFARGTNLFDSDIDLNFVYEDKSYKAYEELISSMLADILGKYRDFVHDSIPHHTINSDMTENDSLSTRLVFKDGKIDHNITKGNIRLMDKLYRASNSRESFIKYYIERMNGKEIDEWIYFEEDITGCLSSDVLDYIRVLENGMRSNNLESYLRDFEEEIKRLKDDISSSNVNDVSVIKRLFKNHAFKVIYEYLILKGKVSKKDFYYQKVGDLLAEEPAANIIEEYFKEIMLLGYLCSKKEIEFRTRYSQTMPDEFKKYYKEMRGADLVDNLSSKLTAVLNHILNMIKNMKVDSDETKFNAKEEHINIANYSPLSHINNVSKEYHHNYFVMPLVEHDGKIVPMHPDTFSDLGLDSKRIVGKKTVFPTSSTRTVYDEETNDCYKLAVLRQITRSIRSLSQKEIKRSIIATDYLSRVSYPKFFIIPEEPHSFNDEIYNYIIRKMPEKRVYPWFYLIVSNKFSKQFMMEVIARIIDIWFYYASNGIYFESFHTQNLLVDDDGNVYYRDLSDIRILEEDIMCPSYLDELENDKELHSVFFDRSVLSQNLEHFIKYRKDITDEDIELIKRMINDSMERYGVELPDYSMNYDKNRDGHHPIKVELVRLRRR